MFLVTILVVRCISVHVTLKIRKSIQDFGKETKPTKEHVLPEARSLQGTGRKVWGILPASASRQSKVNSIFAKAFAGKCHGCHFITFSKESGHQKLFRILEKLLPQYFEDQKRLLVKSPAFSKLLMLSHDYQLTPETCWGKIIFSHASLFNILKIINCRSLYNKINVALH